jgi:hypothetical protein
MYVCVLGLFVKSKASNPEGKLTSSPVNEAMYNAKTIATK